jgi:hypothetical protein
MQVAVVFLSSTSSDCEYLIPMDFSDDLLTAIGAWQNGWRENQSLRVQLANNLRAVAGALPERFRTVEDTCYRKRFLHKGELADLILNDERNEGMVSWTTKLEFAERFKGLTKPGAVSGAIFRHKAIATEVVVNIAALWTCPEFVAAAESYRQRDGASSIALFNFADSQGEVVLETPLRASEIVALTGASSPFDDLCDQAGIAEAERDHLFRDLVAQGGCPGEFRYISEDAAQRAIAATIRKMHMRLSELKNGSSTTDVVPSSGQPNR